MYSGLFQATYHPTLKVSDRHLAPLSVGSPSSDQFRQSPQVGKEPHLVRELMSVGVRTDTSGSSSPRDKCGVRRFVEGSIFPSYSCRHPIIQRLRP
jgi:hypothetical protein